MVTRRTNALAAAVLRASFMLTIASVATAATAPAQSPETLVFRQVRESVVQVEAGLSSGSGFLIGAPGLVATNAHVVAGSDTVSVYVDPRRRVLARVLIRDDGQDAAILQIPEDSCGGCRPLPLADEATLQGLEVGTPVMVVGYPLHQPITMTRGIITTIARGAVLTDAAINPGNSGGPVLLPSGTVVAIATYRQPDGSGAWSGLGGGILVDLLRPLLATRTAHVESWRDTTHLPVLPDDRYSPTLLSTIADTTPARYYGRLGGIDVGPFTLRIGTPLAQYVNDLTLGRRTSQERRRREERVEVPISERYNAVQVTRDWQAHVGDETIPVVGISVIPNIGETFGSGLARGMSVALFGVAVPAVVKYKGDVRGLLLRRDGEHVPALSGGHAPTPMLVEDMWVQASDVADYGYYLFAPDAFRPNADGTVPTIELEIRDLKAPTKVRKTTLDPIVVARVWNDFTGYYTSRGRAARPFPIVRECGAVATLGGMGASQPVCEDVAKPAR